MHKEYLLSALDQAKLGQGQCAPNPSVGAVAVQDGRIIAEAWHRGAGLPHAEQTLLAQLPPHCQNVTLYVTLEPCNHWGRTPPCVEAIIAYGIRRVVYAYADPNPLVAVNRTPTILREHGIEVLHYPLPEIDRFYQSYHYWVQTHKPWVTVKIAHTLDGHTTGIDGEKVTISNASCSVFTHQQRKATDVILTTSRTILQDDPQFTVRLPGGESQGKPLAILDTYLKLPDHMQAFRLAKHSIIYHSDAEKLRQPHPNCTYHGVPMLQGGLDLAAVLGHLGALGYHDVWVEAGQQLFTALHQAHLVQRTYIYIAPMIMGGKQSSLYADMPKLNEAKATSWQVLDDNVVLTIDW